MSADKAWEDLAHGSREALAQLGYMVGPDCLPGEPDACGGTFAQHALAHLSALKAVADHHLAHLHAPPLTAAQIYSDTLAGLDCRKTCT